MNITLPQTKLEPGQIHRLKQQAEELEGVFLNLLTKEMFATAKSDNGFGGGFGEETWRSMQAEQLANSMAQNGGLGIADQLLGDMIAMQEAAQTTQSRATGVYR
ncbi:MAG: rod-binding protein [Devosia sp.]|nr:rod-binding protein [Devosia sp.]